MLMSVSAQQSSSSIPALTRSELVMSDKKDIWIRVWLTWLSWHLSSRKPRQSFSKWYSCQHIHSNPFDIVLFDRVIENSNFILPRSDSPEHLVLNNLNFRTLVHRPGLIFDHTKSNLWSWSVSHFPVSNWSNLTSNFYEMGSTRGSAKR